MKKSKFRELKKKREKAENKAKKKAKKEANNTKNTKENTKSSSDNLEATKPLFGAKGVLKDIFKNNSN